MEPTLAMVIPVLDDAEPLARLLPEARSIADEVCVVDGGSEDRSADVAREAGATLVESPRGRGTQLNAGAAATTSDVIVFVHADTCLPPGAREGVLGAIDSGAVGGGFCVRFDDPSWAFRLGSRIVSLRTRLFALPLGDQAQFVERSAFEALDGFREWPILEDLDMARRLKRLGRVSVIDAPVVTSSRRFRRHGIVKTVLRNWLIFALYRLGIPPERLAHLYPPLSSRRR